MELVYEQLHRHLLKRDIIHADETPCQVLKEEGKMAQSKSCMWLYGSRNDGLSPIRLYDHQPSRGGYHAHMRRYWHDALPGKSKKSPNKTPAEIGFDHCNMKFSFEDSIGYVMEVYYIPYYIAINYM